ncbi:MAG TPA: adenylosuccinate lyase, partial [Halanaerobiales bacterium]|nr:adenylosuccinate lyase [Halanaerobiales bacterium]
MIGRYSLPQMEEIWSEENKYKKWLEIEIAVCKAKAELGEIPKKAAKKIENNSKLDLERIKEIEKTTRHDMLAFIESINEKLGNESKYVHQGLTSSDIKDTARALQMKESVELILKDLNKMKKVLKEKAILHKKTIMIGRTHGVHAEPVTWGLKMALWYEEIKRHIKRMENILDLVSVGQVSGAVGTYTSVSPKIEEEVCKKLGLKPAPISNQIMQRDRQSDFLNHLALIAASLEKFATEIRNLQRTDILEVEEGFRKGQKGSSAMPHKKNPIVCERITGLARVVRGNVVPGLENISLWHERDLTHSSVERVILPDSSILVDYALQKFKEVLEELKINKDNMRKNMDRTHGLIFSQRVMLALVDKGLEREDAYEMAQRNALKAWENKEDYKKL